MGDGEMMVEVGEDRVEAPMPLPSTLIAIANQLANPARADLFHAACEQVTTYGRDHPESVGTSDNCKHLLAALSLGSPPPALMKPHTAASNVDDPRAAADSECMAPACTALATLLLHNRMRSMLRLHPWLQRVVACLAVPDHADGALPFLALLLNVLADQVSRELLTRHAAVSRHLVRLFSSASEAVSARACACMNNLCLGNRAALVPLSHAGIIPLAVARLVHLRPGMYAHRVSLLLAELSRDSALEQQIAAGGLEACALRRTTSECSLGEEDDGDETGTAAEADAKAQPDECVSVAASVR